jgi:hypothetical protein
MEAMAMKMRARTAALDDPRRGAGWMAARLAEIPALGKCADLEHFRGWTENPRYGERWHSVRLFFGISGFGANAYEADAGEELVLSHREAEGGRYEELYVLLSGSAEFTCDGETIVVEAGDAVFVRPEVHRSAVALDDDTSWIAVAGLDGEPYRHWNGDH